MRPELLKTKLYIPSTVSTVERNRLFSLLDESLGRKLILVTAPAGFGKSSLVSDWINLYIKPAESYCLSWISLDEEDNDTRRFLLYLLGALQSVDAGLGKNLFSVLAGAEEINIENILTTLINEIMDLPKQILLVLDDYHLIESVELDQALSFFLDYLPSNLHLVVISRIDPSFNLPRLRARGQMSEVRASDLRFSQQEIRELLKVLLDIELTAKQIDLLEVRTEGWIAGLQLAALSMKGTGDVDSFVSSFTGSNRYIIDYLADEVLSDLPDETVDFLYQTSILSSFCASLCNALTGNVRGQETLEMLERKNLFIIALDDDRCWFRYHHLFSDLLQRRLGSAEPSQIADLHRNAALWFLDQDDFGKAFGHFVKSGSYKEAVEILESKWQIYIQQGRVGQIKKMLDSLPLSDLESSAPISMAQCWLCCFEEKFQSIPTYLQQVYSAMNTVSRKEVQLDSMKLVIIPCLAETMESIVSSFSGNPDHAVAHGEKAIELIPSKAPPNVRGQLYTSVAYWLALAYDKLGNTDKACSLHLEMIEMMRHSGNQMSASNSLMEISRIYLKEGQVKELLVLCENQLKVISEKGWQNLPPSGVVKLIYSKALKISGSQREAETFFQEGLKLIQPIMSPRFKSLIDHQRPADSLIEPLSLREMDVLNLVSRGFSNSQICDHLFLALSTVKGHNRNIFDKLQVKSRTEAVVKARNLGLIP